MERTASTIAKRINRADLLRALGGQQTDLLPSMAEACGFEPPEKPTPSLKLPPLPEVSRRNIEQPTQQAKPKPTTSDQQPHYYRVTQRWQNQTMPETAEEQAKLKPQWLQDTAELDPQTIEPLPIPPAEKEPLVVWAKLWPVLRHVLSTQKQTRQPDMRAIVRTLANGHLLTRIPRKTRQRWVANVRVLLDRPERTQLFNQDYNRLLEQLKRLRGTTGLEIQTLVRQAGGRVRIESSKQRKTQDWRIPSAGSSVFILSDLGLLDESGIAQRAWLRLGKQLRQAGCQPVVFIPLPERYLTPELTALYDCICWHRNSHLQPVQTLLPRDQEAISPLQQDKQNAQDLLAWLSPAVRVEPALLRAVRHQLSLQTADVGHEAAAWLHEDVVPSSLGFHFQADGAVVAKYRQRLHQLVQTQPQRARAIARLIYRYHRHLFPSQRIEEILLLAQILGERVPIDRQEIKWAEQHMRELIKAAFERGDELPGIKPYALHQLARQHDGMVAKHNFYQVVWGAKQSQNGKLDASCIPAGYDLENILAYVDFKPTQKRHYVLSQQGKQSLQLSTQQGFMRGAENGFISGSALAEFSTASPYYALPQNDTDILTYPLSEQPSQQIDIAGQSFVIERFTKPKWADQISMTHQGLTAISAGETYYWYEPIIRGGDTLPGAWYPAQQIDAGLVRDQYGLYADVQIAGITQRFRWIEPTTFIMGSPRDEKGRYDDETQHQVTLTQGYWLADTSCTQALWQAVIGENPSDFQDAENPVENVSWVDVDTFIQQLKPQYPELMLRLPTEAEWENACRAGTTGAFNFDGELSLDKVNYRGTWEFDLETWGDGALHKTTKAKSYVPNSWGLYQMHGNVWEWCLDWHESYPSTSVVDPSGAESGSRRVLRGGSWFDPGGRCRSASRNSDDPSLRIILIGFRLALGHLSVQS